MRGAGKKSDKTKHLGIFVLLFLLLLLISNSTYKVYKKKETAEEALSKMNSEMVDIENRIAILRRSEKRLSNDEGIEFELRKKFSVASAGESLAVIVDGDKKDGNESGDQSLWSKIKVFFGF